MLFSCGPHGPRVTTTQWSAPSWYNSVDGRGQRSGPPDSGSPWYRCFSRSTEKTLDFVLFIMHSVFLPRGASIPLAFIGGPMSHQMSHRDQPDTICSDNSPSAGRDSLKTSPWMWLTAGARGPGPLNVAAKNQKHSGETLCSLFKLLSTICAARRISWQPNKQAAMMASSVPLSFHSASVMLLCVEKCLYKTRPPLSLPLSHMRVLFPSCRHHTPVHALECLQMRAPSDLPHDGRSGSIRGAFLLLSTQFPDIDSTCTRTVIFLFFSAC